MGTVIFLAMTCKAEGCDSQKIHARGYCRAHYMRLWKTGGLGEGKPNRGRMLDHPLYFRWTRSRLRGALCPEWAADFWRFADDIGSAPAGAKKLFPLDASAPLGPGNWRWSEKLEGDRKNAYYRDWYKNSPKSRDRLYQKQYGIGIADYDAMLADQGGVCAICRRAETSIVRRGVNEDTRRLAVDHDHTTGEVRGLLCADCNRAIGLFCDDAATAFRAGAYLAQSGKVRKIS